MPWLPGTYDPELNLYYFGTGNPNPVLAGQSRAGDNLYTCSIVAIDPDTGKMAWYYQATPHDTHDWDAAQVRPDRRRHRLQARNRSRIEPNGLFFCRTHEKKQHILPAPMVDSITGTRA